MQKRLITLLIFLFVLGLMAMTNPTKEEYTSWAQEKAVAQSDGFLEKMLTALFGDEAFESSTRTHNFVFFTVYSTELPQSEKFKVVGLFRNFIPIQTAQEEEQPVVATLPAEDTDSITNSASSPEVAEEAVSDQNFQKPPATASSIVRVVGSEGTFELPLIGVEAGYGIGFERKPSLLPKQPLPDLQVDLPADQASQLAVYWINDGDDIHGHTYIAPRGWTVQSAGIGANGSTSLELVSSDQRISYFHAGACVGCTYSYIGEYFPNLHDWAIENGVHSEIETHPDWNIVPIDDHKVAYSYWNSNGQEVNGVAIEHHGEGQHPFFWKADVMIEDHELATTILNSYLVTF